MLARQLLSSSSRAHHVAGLAAENLDISILSGSVVHENLHLKKTAFDALALPVVVKSGMASMR